MIFLLLIGGALAVVLGLVICFDEDMPGGFAKTIIPAVGLSGIIWGMYEWKNLPPDPQKTIETRIEEEFNSCKYSLSESDVISSTKMTVQEICARSMKPVREMYEGIEYPPKKPIPTEVKE